MQSYWLPWIIWLLVELACVTAAIITGIVAICSQDEARRKAIDGLLLSATLVYAVGFTAVLLPQKTSQTVKTAQEAFTLSYIKQADLQAESLQTADNVDKLGQPWLWIARADGVPPLASDLSKAEIWLRATAESHPADASLAARLAIVEHESGGDAGKVFDNYIRATAQSHAKDPRLAARLAIVQNATGNDAGRVFDNYKRADGHMTPLLNALSGLYGHKSNDTVGDTAAIIRAGLPKGWYQQKALMSAYKDTQDAQALQSKQDESVRNWQLRYAAYQTVRAVCCIVFLLTLGLLPFAWYRTKVSMDDPPNYGFRKAYGCLLSLLYAQFAAGFFCGFAVSVAVGLKVATFDSGSFTVITLASAIVAGVVAAVSTIYFCVCRPAQISLAQLWSGPTPITAKRLIVTGFVGFCCAVGMNCLTRIVAGFIPNSPHGTNNPLQLHMSDALATADVGLILWYALVAVILAPIIEETLFRGLLYPWLRKRVGIILAAVISAILFALFHFDARGAIQYCALGIILALVYERSRSIPAVALVHALWNAWVLAIMSWLMP